MAYAVCNGKMMQLNQEVRYRGCFKQKYLLQGAQR